MQITQPNLNDAAHTLPRMPPWVTSVRTQTIEDVAFLSGAALSHLHVVLSRQYVPQTLLRARLALSASEACVVFSGRPERAGGLRDAVLLLRPGDLPGPAGEVYLCWRRAVEQPVSSSALHWALPMRDSALARCWNGSADHAGSARAGGGFDG